MKIILGGETFDYDGRVQPMSEALAIEKMYEKRYVQWQEDLNNGLLEAFCILAWVIWRRDGRDVPYGDIIEGKADFDVNEMVKSLMDGWAAEADAAKAAAAAADPTGPPDPAGTPGTGKNT